MIETKKCGSCKQEKSLSEFNKRGKTEKGAIRYQPFCRECNKVASKKYYSENKEKHKSVTRRRSARNRTDNMIELQLLKAKIGCSQCNEKDPRCLDFHHIDKESKESTVANLWTRFSKEKARIEMEKCILLCSNCHRKHHLKLYIELPL